MAGGSSGRSAESGQDPQNDLLEGDFTVLDKKAVKLIPSDFREKFIRLCDRQKRGRRLKPGGAARRFSYGTRLEDGQTYLSMIKKSNSEGGDIEFVMSDNRSGGMKWTIAGNRLRLFGVVLPETVKSVLGSLKGRPVGDFCEISGIFSDINACRILDIKEAESPSEDKINLLIQFEIESCEISRKDINKQKALKLFV